VNRSLDIMQRSARRAHNRRWPHQPSLVLALLLAVVGLSLGVARNALAAPEAHILRIDPRAGIAGGAPVLTTVVEIVQFNSLSSALEPCASMTGFAPTIDCLSSTLEKPNATWSPFPFPKANARLLVKVDGSDTLATIAGDPKKWGDSQRDPEVGTAWLVALDASANMGTRYAEARAVAREFIEAMQPNDLMDLMIFDDRLVIHNSKWKTFAERNSLVNVLNDQPSTAVSHGRDRPLFDELKRMTADGFNDLGNSQGPQKIPLHQAMVLLSNGGGRNDAGSAAPSADIFHQYATKGRFPEDNTSVPKTPLPIISIWFPSQSSLLNDVYRNNDEQFMQSLANPEIGGFFDIVREGQGLAKGKTIIGLVKARFNAMYIVKWSLACLNSSLEQTFNLEFQNTSPIIKGDATFKDVPIGLDPTQWPLSVDLAKTKAEADANPIYPGGTFKVYGDFCWGGDKTRAEAYFVPAGTKPDPNANSTDPALAKRAMQQLIAQNMRGGAKDASDTFVVFDVPEDEKILDGQGENAVAHVVVYDNKAHRASGHDAKAILTLKAKKPPLNTLLIAGAASLIVVILLLVIVLMRGGGGGGGKRRAQAIAAPAGGMPPGYGMPPPGGYGPPPGGYPPPGGPGGYGGPGVGGGGMGGGVGGGGMGGGVGGGGMGGGGMGGPPPGGFAGQVAGQSRPPPAVQPANMVGYAPSPGAPGGPGGVPMGGVGAPAFAPGIAGGGPVGPPIGPVSAGVVQVRCPSCQMTTMATPGQSSVCFSCGQPLPPSVTGSPEAVPLFPLTGQLGESNLAPPPDPYGRGVPSKALIVGPPGQFPILPGAEVRVGRDASLCAVALTEPRVSGVHSTLKFESACLWVRDEQSNNGTFIAGERIPPGAWTPVPPGRQLRFGPVEFDVRFET
jgi:hypothetical protein